MISLIQNTLQIKDNNLVRNVLTEVKLARENINKYKEDYINAKRNLTNSTDNQNMTEKEIKRAVFFNETGISELEQITTNQNTEGIKYSFIDKYFKSVATRMKFSEEVQKFFQPIFLNVTNQEDEWKSYQLMYNPKESGNINFINFLVKNRFNEQKVDVIVNQVSLIYKISQFILIEECSIDENGNEEKEVKFITENIEKKDVDDEIEVIQKVLTYTAYKSLMDFLNINENQNIKEKKVLTFLG
jgi:hypothetical protein